MKILVPIDGSDCSFRALEFATGMATRYDAALHVVHITDARDEATDAILERARDVLDANDVEDEPDVRTDISLDFRPSDRIGEDVVELVAEEGYDHVVMGHHGAGAVERAILGSATETVMDAERVPVSVVP
ncbi:probable stress response protein [Halarchaeum acidiphilum MH1-52-1]|uniref:Probable stress response protein n=1 Tax=Halarchaeum acidiphilum MH1-52-1 TaxID=1261545 RepID=U2YVU8_9EURY|nr:universal stress protein [Halarchaeum acidiphilum]GAD53155.1 probable stress response protein [Halarchaeum acidiphilum MH1-52-1]